jgi:hypothetical protein
MGGTYLTVQRNIQEDLNIQERRCDKLKSLIINLILIKRIITSKFVFLNFLTYVFPVMTLFYVFVNYFS